MIERKKKKSNSAYPATLQNMEPHDKRIAPPHVLLYHASR